MMIFPSKLISVLLCLRIHDCPAMNCRVSKTHIAARLSIKVKSRSGAKFNLVRPRSCEIDFDEFYK